MPARPSIALHHLTKRFGSLTAVSELTLEVAAGEIVGFLGPNGAGKTTTLRTLLGFLRPSQGGCSILGGTPAHDVSLRRRIGYLPGDVPAACRPGPANKKSSTEHRGGL